MGPDFNDPKPSYANPEPAAAPLTPSFDWRHWARRLLVCNPFFLCSAALLLFGVNRLSVDPNFLGDEQANLLFNYFALQFYELLVITTAILLARRNIWYDSALLVVVERVCDGALEASPVHEGHRGPRAARLRHVRRARRHRQA